jgi:outer membrane protein assembly factor BamB
MKRDMHPRSAPLRAGWVAALAIAAAPLAAGCASLPTQSNADDMDALRAVPRDPLGRPVLALRWKHATADRREDSNPQEFAGALVWRDTVYVAGQGGMLWALSAQNGTPRWKAKIGSVSTTPAVDRGWLYVGTDDGELVSVDAQTGAVKWRYASRGPIGEPPVVVGDLVLFANEADQVSAVDALTGKFRWQYRSETPEEYTLRGHAGLAVDGDLVFTGFANGSLVALRTTTGSVAWLASLTAGSDRFVDVDSTPVVVGGTVYATSSSGGAYALDKATGLVRWQMPLSDGPKSQPNPGNAGGITADELGLYVAAADQGIYALDFNGNVKWRQGAHGGGEPAPPVVSGEYLLYALAGEGLFVADRRTGEVLQWFDPGDGVSSPPTIADDDRVYVLSNRGILYALDLERF